MCQGKSDAVGQAVGQAVGPATWQYLADVRQLASVVRGFACLRRWGLWKLSCGSC